MSSPASPFHTRTCRYGTEGIRQAADVIRAGECVAVPTETVYGLAANACESEAVARIYAAKGRPRFNPLIVHVADFAMADQLAVFDPVARALADRFWPGPLTLVLPVRTDSGLSALVTAGLPTVALRMPAHPAIAELIRACGVPLAAPSANRSGTISPTSAEHVLRSLGGRISLIVDAGPTEKGVESTIVATSPQAVRVLRPGPITIPMLEDASGLPVSRNESSSIEAPGQLASHYAPSKPLRLNATEWRDDEYRIGFGEHDGDENLSKTGDLVEAAAHLFAALHRADASAHSRIAVAPIPSTDLGAAINDRLGRAAA
ncbi:L-threonylcarbamoyladenylate synthase [Sphingobium subterraneum]|uniref:Threonylcarbamoyl-AMP synthase n=1 Tax=Sphingobium subterraneum TaxID=627688 RepID=A0A841IWE8_9SPHN|nr:L-threonylcarbamoyladenylate synthase [Sphingobium subterraneum]MBB6122684.1 L-threonylcarbamoyladenylate synthase [Sphingobium subterraneum]